MRSSQKGGQASRTVFISKSTASEAQDRILRSADALRQLLLWNCDCKILTTALCFGLRQYSISCIRFFFPHTSSGPCPLRFALHMIVVFFLTDFGRANLSVNHSWIFRVLQQVHRERASKLSALRRASLSAWWITKCALFSFGLQWLFTDLEIDVHRIHVISQTARFRIATRSRTLADGFAKTQTARDSLLVTPQALWPEWVTVRHRSMAICYYVGLQLCSQFGTVLIRYCASRYIKFKRTRVSL